MAFFGEWLAARRAELGLTLRDIAEAVGAPPSKVSLWERGYEDPPYEVRDACWDALKKDGEIPPIDPAPSILKHARPGAEVRFLPPRRGRGPKSWVEEWAESKKTTLDEVLRAFGMSGAVKYHLRKGKLPSRETQWKLAAYLEIPAEILEQHGWRAAPDPAAEA